MRPEESPVVYQYVSLENKDPQVDGSKGWTCVYSVKKDTLLFSF